MYNKLCLVVEGSRKISIICENAPFHKEFASKSAKDSCKGVSQYEMAKFIVKKINKDFRSFTNFCSICEIDSRDFKKLLNKSLGASKICDEMYARLSKVYDFCRYFKGKGYLYISPRILLNVRREIVGDYGSLLLFAKCHELRPDYVYKFFGNSTRALNKKTRSRESGVSNCRALYDKLIEMGYLKLK